MTKLTMLLPRFSLCAFFLIVGISLTEAIKCFEYRRAEMETKPANMSTVVCKSGIQYCVKTVVMYNYNNGGPEGTAQIRTKARCAYSDAECLDIGCVQQPPTDIMGIKRTNIHCCSREDLSNASTKLPASAMMTIVAVIALLCLLFTS